MFGLGSTEIIVIVVAGLLLFGGKKLSEFARSLGRFSGEFQKGKVEIEQELAKARDSVSVSEVTETVAKKK